MSKVFLRNLHSSSRAASHVGALPIRIPTGVSFEFPASSISTVSLGSTAAPRQFLVRGPLGTQTLDVPAPIILTPGDTELKVSVHDASEKKQRSLWGLTRSLINNAIVGVSSGYSVDLRLVGVGFRAAVEPIPEVFQEMQQQMPRVVRPPRPGAPAYQPPPPPTQRLNMKLGYAHPVIIDIPSGITVTVPAPTQISLKGTDKQKLGLFAAKIRRWRKPEPYRGKHERVVFQVDLGGTVTASAFLTIEPLNPSLRAIHLHASTRLEILGVSLSAPHDHHPLLSTPAHFAHVDPFVPLPVREPPLDLRSHPEIKRRSWAAVDEREEGELAIAVTGGWIRLLDGEARLAPIEIRVDYRFGPNDGITFDDRVVATSGSPRCWAPCIDNIWERCTWELDFVVPVGLTAVSSGELQEQVVHPHNPNKVVFSYLQTTPTSSQHMGFAIGAFEALEVSDKILAFGQDVELSASESLVGAMSFYSTEFGAYPFQDFKVVFLPDVIGEVYAGMAIVSQDLLESDPSQAIDTRLDLALALVQQWIGINIIPKSLSDTWLVRGMALYLRGLYVKHIFGNNDYRFRLRRDIDRCARMDQGRQPMCIPGSFSVDHSLINLKAPLVLHILDRHMANAGTSLGLSRIIPRIFLAAFSDELAGNTLSTQYFFRTCRKISGLDLSTFQDQWVYGTGCPHFRIQTAFTRKKFLIEFGVQQIGVVFEGGLTVRVHEADGAPFEHILDIKQSWKQYNLPFNSKYKRRKSVRRQEAAEEDRFLETFAYPPWDDESIRTSWRVSDWDAQQLAEMDEAGYEWIRLDPECEWIATFEFQQQPWFWVVQLQGDRDVVGQLEAIQHLQHVRLPIVASELARTVLVRNYYYRVRMEAARALMQFNTAECDFLGSFLLLKLAETIEDETLADRFVKQVVISALSDMRDPISRVTAPACRQMLLDQPMSPTVISALGNIVPPVPEMLDRAMTIDRMVPSSQNKISVAALQTLLKIILSGQQTNDARIFLAYTREGNYERLRLLAFDCLLACKPPGRSSAVDQYLLDVLNSDSSSVVRRHVAKGLSESILVSLALGELGAGENDLAIIKAIRREFAHKEQFLDGVKRLLLSSASIDDDVLRFAYIKLAEMLSASQPEPQPGRIITLATPSEAPAAPKIRINLEPSPPPQPVKLTIRKKVPKAQVAGLSDMDMAAIGNALRKLRSDKSSVPFRQPVDPVRDGAPDYPRIVKNPMDLSTAAAKLDSGLYMNREQFVDDMRLICRNCFLYNGPETPMYRAGKAFEAVFEKLWAKTEATLSSLPAEPLPTRPEAEKPAPQDRSEVRPKLVLKQPIKPPATALNEARKSDPPMPPPPLPLAKTKSKRRSPEIDDMLGAELDAMERQLSPERPPKRQASVPVQQSSAPPTQTAPPPTSSSAAPSSATSVPYQNTPIRKRRSKAFLKQLMQHPKAFLFLRPVDPVKDGCPTYLQEIKHPMDFGTIEKKIDRYRTMGQLARDIELVFANCRRFNPPGDITALADEVEAFYFREWPKVANPKMTADERKAMMALVNRAFKEESSFLFREAVDPVALQIPHYFDVIPKEDARDLSLIKRKLEKTYSTAQQVDEDIALMVENAKIFNVEGPIVETTKTFERWWKAQREKMDI